MSADLPARLREEWRRFHDLGRPGQRETVLVQDAATGIGEQESAEVASGG
jgi:hypothetical protein